MVRKNYIKHFTNVIKIITLCTYVHSYSTTPPPPGKNKYLIDEKERAFKYFKKQREIQHRHYHAMLKMAHASMERLNKVKKMVKKAETTGSVTGDDMAALNDMLPGGFN